LEWNELISGKKHTRQNEGEATKRDAASGAELRHAKTSFLCRGAWRGNK
jgi:hypothetical protein